VTPETLDHVALWVADRDRIADFVTARVGMHVVERTDDKKEFRKKNIRKRDKEKEI